MDGLKLKYFVLKPEGDTPHAIASRAAIRKYAEITAKLLGEDAGDFTEDLLIWADIEEMKLKDKVQKNGERIKQL